MSSTTQDSGLGLAQEVSLHSSLYKPRGSSVQGYDRIYYLHENGLRGISLSNALEYRVSAWPNEQRLWTLSSVGTYRSKMSFRLHKTQLDGREPFSIPKGVVRVKNGQLQPIPMGKAVQCAAQVVERWLYNNGSPLGLQAEHIHIDALAEIGGSLQIFLRRGQQVLPRDGIVFSCREQRLIRP